MSEDTKPSEQTYKLTFTNSRKKDIALQLEPEGMVISIPPKTTYEVIFSQDIKNYVNFVFEEYDDGEPFYGLYSYGYPYQVYYDGKLIYQSP
jgi:hypothetical protein